MMPKTLSLPSRWRSLWPALALLVAAALTLPTARAEITDGVIKVGLLTDVDGPYKDSAGQGSLIALELAAEEFGYQIDGYPVEILMEDHDNDPEVATKKAKLLKSKNVDVVIGMPSSAAALAVQKTLMDTPMVIIHNGAGTTLLTGKFCNPTGIHWQYNTAAFTSAVGAAVANDQQGAEWIVVTLDHPFGQGIYNGLKETVEPLGGEIIDVIYHGFSEKNFFPIIEKAMKQEPDVLAFGNAGAGLVAAIRQTKELGVALKGTQVVSVMTLLQDIRAVGLYAAAGLQFVVPYYWDTTEASREYAETFRSRYGTVPSSAQIANYVAIKHYFKAIRESGADQGKPVVRQMKKMPVNDGITQNGNIRPDGRLVHDMNFMQVKSPSESEGVMDYFKLIRKIPGEQAFPPMDREACSFLSAEGN